MTAHLNPQPSPRWHPHPIRTKLRDERGAVTAEYAIATIAAVGFAALLVVILRSDEVRTMLLELVRHALSVPV